MTPKSAAEKQLLLPGTKADAGKGLDSAAAHGRIRHRQILKEIEEPDPAGGIAAIYRQRVRPIKTRTIRLLGKKAPARILHSLLGYEVQASYKRIQCPDMVTARYVKLFTELGCRAIRMPYDPTVTAKLIPQLERAQDKVVSEVAARFPRERRVQLYVLRQLYGLIRKQLKAE
jgi:hypothetical protein